ncbi:MAG: hypothetical protein SFV24_21720 [Gemmatimonadales bacterium]|nr:hypothetical protein [Gemmatimonadales bacterium]MDX2060444.1 hypothetical protein [Gemmatimonadales bacterium]
MTVVAGAVAIFRGPLGKAIARRLEGGAAPPADLEARLQDLEARVLAGEEERNELLGRLEFAERLLLQNKESARELPR